MNTGGSTDFSKAWVRFASEWFRARIFSNNLLSAHFHLEPPSVSFALLQETRWNFFPRNNRAVTPQKAKDKKHGRKERFHGLQEKRNYYLEHFFSAFSSASSVAVFQTEGFCSRTRDSSNRSCQEKSCRVSHETEAEDSQNYSWFLLKVFSSGDNTQEHKQQQIK